MVQDFLAGRKQRVIVNGTKSRCAIVLSGIPQGSVLAPILFVISINNLIDSVQGTAKSFKDYPNCMGIGSTQ